MLKIHSSFGIPQLGDRGRTIRVFLPRNYTTSNRNYPVLYMHDGQNLFDPETAFGGRDWQIARTMDKMPLAKQLIIVGIDNGEENRINEYAPFESENGGGEGDAYLQFIAETLKPVIDSEYRTMPEKEATGIAGSSMGGLISFYAGLRYRGVFGKIGVLSPALWVNPTVINILENGLDPQSRFYVVASKTESKTMESTLTAVYWALKNAGLSDGDLRVIVRDRGKHNEIFWGREFRQMVEWLF